MSDRQGSKACNDSLKSYKGMMCCRNPSCQNDRHISVDTNEEMNRDVCEEKIS